MGHSIHDLLEEFRQAATSNRDLGDKFEVLIANYLRLDPLFKDRFKAVWIWSEWPQRGKQVDTGIDLVAEESTGGYCAIQCKFFDPSHTLQKSDIDSFFTASGRKPFTSRLIVSTTDKWSIHAEDALVNQTIPVTRLRVQDLADSPIDWSDFSFKKSKGLKLRDKKKLRDHQKIAVQKVVDGFKKNDRGKLIMACGTGKTFTSLRLAERLNPKGGAVLFLVPSISLLSQSLKEWTAESEVLLHNMAVCSDSHVGRKSDSEDIQAHDLPFPASTDGSRLAKIYQAFEGKGKLNVVYSTYQSIDAIAAAQRKGLPEFDLIICDEAHRTTGVTLEGEDESHFVKVHDNKFIKGKKRLYMTATPRIFSDGVRAQAQENNAELCSMDDDSLFGPEFHRLGFSEAVGKGLLADYKVMVLAVDEKYVSKTFQSQLAEDGELRLEDAVKITGCWNGLSKRMAKDSQDSENDSAPMRRAVAFSRSIKDSKRLASMFQGIVQRYTESLPEEEEVLNCEVDHVDGSFNALQRNRMLDWLKEDTSSNGQVCRILSNARCLSEGVDVPALDAVLFLNPRNSIVDVVQSVGRVMRKAEGKKYGYVILPIGIPADVRPEDALKENQKYKVVWQVLQALRAHDDRFNATVNQIELNRDRPDQIQVIGVGGGNGDEGDGGDSKPRPSGNGFQLTLNLPWLEEWRDAIYAKIVEKCGDRRYWESWARDVAQIAERHSTRIRAILEGPSKPRRAAFAEFLKGLQDNLNPSITQNDAIEMLSQHLITKPVFDALFDGYEFTKFNPVSVAMEKMLHTLEDQSLEKETESLDRFYASVKERARGIDNAAGKQQVIKELYDKFFNTAFPRMAERLGIVYTPVELVDFIIKSVNEVLKDEFGVGLSERGIHVLDPFTGTGTFMVRLLQSGIIRPEDLLHKYKNELHANEIVLLAYYVAAINIEAAFHSLSKNEYQPFEGIVLTDTFQISEGNSSLIEKMFPENNLRVKRQNQSPIRVIMGNPPYSVGQDSQNDGNQNMEYPALDDRISETYAAKSVAGLKRNVYDSYIRAFRWASDRIKDKGIVCFVSNGSLVGKNSLDGVRKCLVEEFTSIYCFNLRGDAHGSGEVRQKEKGNVFGAGTRTSVAITLLVRNPEKSGKCVLQYKDIGDYLTREEKLKIIDQAQSIRGVDWRTLSPSEEGDWVNQRDPAFGRYIPLGEKSDKTTKSIFSTYSFGLGTNRDSWVYNFSDSVLKKNMEQMIGFYSEQVAAYKRACARAKKGEEISVEDVIDTDSKRISWSRGLKNDVARGRLHSYNPERIVKSIYRPFCKQWVYFDRGLNEMILQTPKMFPTLDVENLAICVVGPGARQAFSALITDTLPDLHLSPDGAQCFPLYIYEKSEGVGDLFHAETANGFIRRENIPDTIHSEFCALYGTLSKKDIFYYVYGILHSLEYKSRFEYDLKKQLPRIPFVSDFWKFSKAGRELAQLHLNYESIEPYDLQESNDMLPLKPKEHFKVSKMTYGKIKKEVDKSTIHINSRVQLSGIPLEAYEYVVNGKSALEWVMERYQVTIDKDSGIPNDPNEWSEDPRYIIDLVRRVVKLSIESVRIVKSLPPLTEVVYVAEEAEWGLRSKVAEQSED